MNVLASTHEVKELYEREVAGKYRGDYEFRRWFLTERLRLDYVMTRAALAEHLRDVVFSSCLEVGPGSGIFTTLAFRRNPEAHFDLLDISEEMKRQFFLEMRAGAGVRYIVDDILTHDFGADTYDLFYSVRAVEYVDDKAALFRKVFQLLRPGGKGVVVTKNPGYARAERGATTRRQHRGKVDDDKLVRLLAAAGFVRISLSPVIVRLPLIERVTMRFSEALFERVYRKPYNPRIARFVESYLVTFEKPGENSAQAPALDRRVLECIGLPGAGKSYIAKRLSKERGLPHIEIAARRERLVRALRFACFHPFFFSRLMRILVKENYRSPRLLKHKLTTVFLDVLAHEEKAEKEWGIIETGFFQLLLSLFEHPIEPRDIASVLSWLRKRPATVCIIEAPTETRSRRMAERGRVPRAGLIAREEARAAWFALLEHNFRILRDCVVAKFRHEVIQNN